MRTWQKVRLGDVCKIIPGYAFKSRDWTDAGVPVLKIKNIQADCTVSLSDIDCVPAEIITAKLDKFRLEDRDILVAMTGATAGKVGRLRTDTPAYLNQRVAKIKPVSADAGFIWAVVSSRQYQEKFFNLADGAAQPNMSGGQIEGVELTLPPPQEQRRIASILSAYDDLIENNTRRIAILGEMARRIYEEWLVHFRFPGHEQTKMVESELGLIPKGWEFTTIGNIATNLDRKRKPLSKMQRETFKGPYPYYGAAKVFDYVQDYLFDGRFVLIAEDGSVITPDGFPVLQLANGKFWANNHTHILQGTGLASTEFIYLSLSDVKIAGYITGAAQPKITQENLNRIPVLLPPPDVMQAFTALLKPKFDLIDVLERKNASLRTTRDLLLPKLIFGELDVTTLEDSMNINTKSAYGESNASPIR